MGLLRAKTSFTHGRAVVAVGALVDAAHPMVKELPDLFEELRADFPWPGDGAKAKGKKDGAKA